MQCFKKFFPLILIVFTLTARAGDLPGNIAKGNIQTGGDFQFSNTWYHSSTTQTYFHLNIPLEYFVADRFALGGVVIYSHNSIGGLSTDTISAGPAGVYYFWTMEKIGAYLSESFTVSKNTGVSPAFLNSTGVGLNYFITPSVALGPGLSYLHLFGAASGYTSYDEIAFSAGFRIYL